jgi:hypothetical protein
VSVKGCEIGVDCGGVGVNDRVRSCCGCELIVGLCGVDAGADFGLVFVCAAPIGIRLCLRGGGVRDCVRGFCVCSAAICLSIACCVSLMSCMNCASFGCLACFGNCSVEFAAS